MTQAFSMATIVVAAVIQTPLPCLHQHAGSGIHAGSSNSGRSTEGLFCTVLMQALFFLLCLPCSLNSLCHSQSLPPEYVH